MERPSREEFATRFATYVGELREIFATRGLKFGRSKDVAGVARALSVSGVLRDEVAAGVRSILYREHEGLSRAELVSVVVVAAGGADLYGSAREGDAVQQIDAFVSGIRRSMRAVEPVEEEVEAAEAGAGEATEVAQAARTAAEIPLQREEVYAEEDVEETLEPVAAAADRTRLLAGIYSQAQKMSQSEREGGAAADGTYFLKAKAEPEAEAIPEEESGDTLEERAAGSYWGWVVGLCVVAVLLAVGLIWRSRSAARVKDVAHEARAVEGGAGADASPAVAAQGGSGPGGVAAMPGRGAVAVARGGSPAAGVAGSAASVPGGMETVAGPALPAAPAGKTAVPDAVAGKVPEPAGAAAPVSEPKHEVAMTPASAAVPNVAVSAAVAGKYVVSSGVMSGNLISAPEPAYPRMAKMWGIEGQVILQAVISSKGQVVAAHVLDGHKMLRASAMHAVRKWRYKPYVVDGKATDVATVVIVNYKMKP